MKHTQNSDFSVLYEIEHPIWKFPEERTTKVPVNLWMPEWMLKKLPKRVVEGILESGGKFRTSFTIPLMDIANIRFR